MTDVRSRSAAQLGRDIEAGRIDARDLTRDFLSAIDEHPYRDLIYVRTTTKRAYQEAEAAAERARAGLRRGPLDGVPVSWKDLFDTAGVATEAGCAMLAGRKPDRDAEVLARATRAGAVCLGKTHMSELAFSGLGINPVAQTSPNRYDPEAAPGGSSSGAAASVAHDLAPVGIGSDTGGSVRIPAAWNGLVGLKTTAGLIPLDGVVPLSPTLDTIGPLTRTVEDAALLFAVMANKPTPDLNGASVKGMRFLVAETTMLDECDDAILTAFEAAVDAIASAGAVIHRGPIPELAEVLDVAAANGAIVNTEGYAIWGELIEEKGDLMLPLIRNRFQSGRDFSAVQGEFSRLSFARLSRSYLARTAGYAAVLAPTSPTPPPNVAALLADEDLFARINMLALRNTRIGNFLGLSAITVPTPADAIGLMLMTPPHAEGRALRLGQAVMEILGAA